MLVRFFLVSLFSLSWGGLKAQESTKPLIAPIAGGLQFKFNESGSQYLKMNIVTQTWFRGIENNPGTAVNGDPQPWTLDAGLRRMRIQIYGEMSPRFLLMLQMGTNNQSFASGGSVSASDSAGAGKRPPFFFHDAYGQFNVIPEKDPAGKKDKFFSLAVGTGLHSWNGVSRLTNASCITLLTADSPIFNWPTVEVSDQFTRQFGLFAKGHIYKIAYRVSINKPFMTSFLPKTGGPAVDNNRGNQVSYNGYFSWQFKDREQTTTAFYAGSYYGKKKILNVGVGFMHNPRGTMTQPVKGQFESHNLTTLGLDVFYDMPIGNPSKEMVFTFYSVWYRYNFGPDYLRTTGVMNPGTKDPSFTGIRALEGFGNRKILMGTGQIWYAHTAFMLPKFSDKIRLQPYVAYSYKELQALNQSGRYYNLGANFLFDGNRAKVSLEYGSRPLYGVADRKVFTRRGEVLACIQFWL